MKTNEIIDLIEKNPGQYEVRTAYYFNPMITSEQIKMLRFDFEMKEHYRQEREKHDLLICAMKMKAAGPFSTPPSLWPLLFVPIIVALVLLSSAAHAAEYKFTFHVQEGNTVSTLKYATEMNDKWEALKDAGIYCGKYFGLGKKKLTEDQINNIIDGCVNPVKE